VALDDLMALHGKVEEAVIDLLDGSSELAAAA
jgi:hypothetical protein